MAHRLILALLTLMTGLVALSGPAQARVSGVGGSEIGAVASIGAQPERAAAIRIVRVPGKLRRVIVIRPLALASPAPIQAVPSVLTGIDRARE